MASPDFRIPTSLEKVNRNTDPVPEDVRGEVQRLMELTNKLDFLGDSNAVLMSLYERTGGDAEKFRDGLKKKIEYYQNIDSVIENSQNPQATVHHIINSLKNEKPTVQ